MSVYIQSRKNVTSVKTEARHFNKYKHRMLFILTDRLVTFSSRKQFNVTFFQNLSSKSTTQTTNFYHTKPPKSTTQTTNIYHPKAPKSTTQNLLPKNHQNLPPKIYYPKPPTSTTQNHQNLPIKPAKIYPTNVHQSDIMQSLIQRFYLCIHVYFIF